MVEYRQSSTGLKFSTIYKKPLSVGQAAKIGRVSKKTVLNWIYRGALKAFTTLGGHYRIWPADLQSFFAKAGMDIQFQFIEERRTTLLIVDDDPVYTMFLKGKLCKEFPNSDIITSDDGYEALLLIGERRPQIVLLDLMMPKFDGFHVLELLKTRKNDFSMKVVVLSAHIDSDIQEKLNATIADYVLEKGSSIHGVLDSLREIVGGASNHPQTLHTLPRAV
jgi:two-component system, OmpR family, response regulator